MIAYLLFAFVASITPGPTNILALDCGATRGFRAALPFALGAAIGAAALVLIVGVGLGELLVRHAAIRQVLAWVGIAWMSYLAWRIFTRAAAATPASGRSAERGARLGLLGGAGLQFVNPKTWMMALTVTTVFARGTQDPLAHTLLLAALFFAIALPCLCAWAGLGQGVSRLALSTRGLARFSQCMAVLLLVSVWLTLFV